MEVKIWETDYDVLSIGQHQNGFTHVRSVTV